MRDLRADAPLPRVGAARIGVFSSSVAESRRLSSLPQRPVNATCSICGRLEDARRVTHRGESTYCRPCLALDQCKHGIWWDETCDKCTDADAALTKLTRALSRAAKASARALEALSSASAEHAAVLREMRETCDFLVALARRAR